MYDFVYIISDELFMSVHLILFIFLSSCIKGINFTMPFLSVSSGENATPSGFIDREEGNDNFEPEMDEAEFLESIGLCKDNFPSIEEQSIQAMRSQLRTVDQRPQSTIVIKGNDTYAFFNFLINSEYLIAKSGSYQGIPPTLLSPVAFEGGTLRAAKMVQGQVKKQKNGKMEKVSILK